MTSYHGWTHRPKSQGGTDPIPVSGGSTQVALLWNWDYVTDNAVPTATWRPVADFANDRGYFNKVTYSTALSGVTYDQDLGTLRGGATAMYEWMAWVQFWEDAQHDGEHRIVSINFGSSDRHITTHIFDTSEGSIAGLKLVGHVHGYVGATTAKLEVWHDAGVDLTIRGAEFQIRKYELDADLTTDFHA